MDLKTSLTPLIERLKRGHKALALTGAGVSTESGIPDFRSAGGLWEKFNPMEYAHIDAFRRDPEKVWRMLFELDEIVTVARPNPAHRALAQLESAGVLLGVITQNIDGLHQDGGSSNVIEFHGSSRQLVCLACGHQVASSSMRPPSSQGPHGPRDPPRCAHCDAVMKPGAVLFGEDIPAGAMEGARALIGEADVVLVCGTSAEVYPASLIPDLARRQGAAVYEFNLEPCLASSVVTGRVLGSVGTTLPALVGLLS